MVSAKDIALLSGKLIDSLYKQKKNIVYTNFKVADSMVLTFDPLISTQIKSVQVHTAV